MPYIPQPLYLSDASWHAPEIQRLLENAYSPWLARSTPDEGQRLYHYTDLTGLRGILCGRSLWLTHAFALNDPGELDYGVQLAAGEIGEVQGRKAAPGSPVHRALGMLRTCVQSAYGPTHHPFVASFCEGGDVLSQWREYGARGGGYAVGVEFSQRTHLGVPDAEHHDPNPYLRKVLYDANEQRRLVRTFLDGFLDAVVQAMEGSVRQQVHRDEWEFAPRLMASHAANYLFDLAISFKHPAFAEEKEWRLLRVLLDHASPGQLRFKEANGELVPYRPIHLYDVADDGAQTFPLREVWLGPTLNTRAASAAVTLLVAHESVADHPIGVPAHVTVRPSATAIR